LDIDPNFTGQATAFDIEMDEAIDHHVKRSYPSNLQPEKGTVHKYYYINPKKGFIC